jgi:Flp pilus assembly protein TadD
MTLLVYRQAADFEFVNMDDDIYVTKNYRLQSGLTGEGIVEAFAKPYGGFWHPLTMISFMVDYEMYGLNAGGYHITNLLFHLANTLLLFVVLRRMTGAVWRSAFVAALFALHPLHVEAVAWISQRKDVLSTLFWLLTMWAYWNYAVRPGAGRYCLVAVMFVLGMMAKPMLVTLPFVFLLLDYWPLGRFRLGQRLPEKQPVFLPAATAPRLIAEKIPLIIISAVASIAAYGAQERLADLPSLETFPLTVRFGNAVVSYVLYMVKMVWPSNLAVYYPHPGEWPLWSVLGSLMVLIAVSIAAVAALRRHPYVFVGWSWYLGTLVPVIGLVQLSEFSMADRYTYVPLIGLFIIGAWGVPDLLKGRRYKTAVLSVLSVSIIAGIMAVTSIQVGYWRSSLTLFGHAVAVTDNNVAALNNLGGALMNAGRIDEAINRFSEAVSVEPGYSPAWNNLGFAFYRGGDLQKALQSLNRALSLNPRFAKAHNNRGLVALKQGNTEDAIRHFHRAVEIAPGYADAYINRGFAEYSRGRYDDAVIPLQEALKIRPNDDQAYNILGAVLYRQGDVPQAVAHFREALRINPGNREAAGNLKAIMSVTAAGNRSAVKEEK